METGTDATGVMVVAALWRMIVKSGDEDGVGAGSQICHNFIFDTGQFCGSDDAGTRGVSLGWYMSRDRMFFAWFLDVQVPEMWRSYSHQLPYKLQIVTLFHNSPKLGYYELF